MEKADVHIGQLKYNVWLLRQTVYCTQEVWVEVGVQKLPRGYVHWASFKIINFRCSNSTLTEKWLWWGWPITFPNSPFTWPNKGVDLSHILGLTMGSCENLWGNKIIIQHIGLDKPSVTGHLWRAENIVSFFYRLSSPEAEAETVFGVPDIY